MHEESHYAERALRAGAKGYIMKRETTKRVIEAIRTVLAGKFYLSEAMEQLITTQFVEGKTLAALSPSSNSATVNWPSSTSLAKDWHSPDSGDAADQHQDRPGLLRAHKRKAQSH